MTRGLTFAFRTTARSLGMARAHATNAARPIGSTPGMTPDELAAMTADTEAAGPVPVSQTDYDLEHVEVRHGRGVTDWLADERPTWAKPGSVRWINVDGVTDGKILERIARRHHLHPLAMEDVIHTHQHPKVDAYRTTDETQADCLYVVARMPYLADGQLISEQVSLFLVGDTVITLQEQPGDAWAEIRKRIDRAGSRIRERGADFLLYALLDAIVDACFPLLEHYSLELEELEGEILTRPEDNPVTRVTALKAELLLLRRAIYPMLELLRKLQNEPEMLGGEIQPYLNDVHDHAVQVLEMTETHRELCGSLTESWMNAMSVRMNEVMKVLTVIASLFIPVSFLAGVFGMNFADLPGSDDPNGFWWFCGACSVVVVVMLGWFRYRRWI